MKTIISQLSKPFSLHKCIVILFSFFGVYSQAQFSNEYREYKTKYDNASLVRLKAEKRIDIKIEGAAIKITQETKNEDLYLNASAIYNSKQSIDFSSFYELESVEASSFIFKNGSYKELKVKEFKEKDELGDSFYDDVKSLNFIYPNLNEGAKSTLYKKEKIKDPRFLNSFYFGLSFPIVNNKITIHADKNIELQFKEFNMDSIDVKFSKQEKKGKNIYTWEFRNAIAYEIEEKSPNYRTLFPHVIPIISSYQIKGEKHRLLENTSDLYHWYYSLVKNINEDETDLELKQIVEKLTFDKKNDLEKVRAIYYWVQKNIKYIAFEYALGGFIPREANAIYKKKYGDCKDNSSILLEMLEIAGIKGHLTWIGTRSIPYKYDEVPTPIVDNHMILAYKNQEDIYYLDATGRYIPLDLPTSFIQGKEALVSIDALNHEIYKVPIVPALKNAYKDEVTLIIEDRSLNGSGNSEFSGYQKIDIFNRLESLNEIKTKDFYNTNFRKGNNKFLITDFSEINKFDYDLNFNVNYTFTLNDYIVKADDELYINLNLVKDVSTLKTKEDRKNDIETRYKYYDEYVVKLMIPETMTVSYMPTSMTVENEFFNSTISYTLEENYILYKHAVKADFIELDLTKQKKLNAFIKKIEKAYKEIIILKEK